MDLFNTILSFILQQNSLFLNIPLSLLGFENNAPKTTTTLKTEYDYIVVGAGSAGAVVASRLSEIPCVSVLLLEAGGSPPPLNDIPVLARNFWFTELDWAYKTVPQKHTGKGLVNRQVIWPSGKGLGGSSLINGMMYVRGNHKNYDDWAQQGAANWSYADVLPYFKKLEDNKNPEFVADGYHGVGGPVTFERPLYNPEIKEPMLETAAMLGYEVVDSNGPSQTGYYNHQANTRNGQRCSTAKAYLIPAENRPNLDIVTHALVKKVVIEDKRAVGVEFDLKEKHNTHTVRAKREVIMSAGAINSAQILMLSGIGPKEHLQNLNIPVVADLRVGDNLQDHPAVPVPFQINPSIPPILEKVLNPLNLLKYFTSKKGVLTSTEGVSLITFLNGLHRPKSAIPDFQLYFAEASSLLIKPEFGLKPDVYGKTFGPYENSTFILCLAQILAPKSRGTVRLDSIDPYKPPLIDPNYFENSDDFDAIVEAQKMCMAIGTSEPMKKKVGSRHLLNPVPGCENLTGDDYFKCVAENIIVTTNHQVGTAKMGDPNDADTVVDPKLRVKGIDGLRVVDASIMPIVPYGNTNVPTIMVGEKASDIIKETLVDACKNSPQVSKKRNDLLLLPKLTILSHII